MSEVPKSDDSGTDVPLEDTLSGGGSNKKKKLLMIIVPIVLLLGGGAGLYFTGVLDKILGHDTAAATAEGGDKAEGAKEGEAPAEGDKSAEGGKEGGKEGEKGAEGEHPAGAAFLKVPDLIVNLNSTGQPRYLRLSIQLELKNEADMKSVESVLPRVIDQFQTYLRELRLEDLRGSKGIYRLQMELLARVNAAAAPVEVKDVLFQEILIQ